MEMWQKCPICNGSGQVENGPVCTNPYSVCPTCKGWKIISVVSGRPPSNDIRPSNSGTITIRGTGDNLPKYDRLYEFGVRITDPLAWMTIPSFNEIYGEDGDKLSNPNSKFTTEEI